MPGAPPREPDNCGGGGKIAALPALEAERDQIAAEQAAAEARAALNDDQITLFLALGGGWTS